MEQGKNKISQEHLGRELHIPPWDEYSDMSDWMSIAEKFVEHITKNYRINEKGKYEGNSNHDENKILDLIRCQTFSSDLFLEGDLVIGVYALISRNEKLIQDIAQLQKNYEQAINDYKQLQKNQETVMENYRLKIYELNEKYKKLEKSEDAILENYQADLNIHYELSNKYKQLQKDYDELLAKKPKGGGKPGRSILSPREQGIILEKLAAGITKTQIAKEHKISRGIIYRLIEKSKKSEI